MLGHKPCSSNKRNLFPCGCGDCGDRDQGPAQFGLGWGLPSWQMATSHHVPVWLFLGRCTWREGKSALRFIILHYWGSNSALCVCWASDILSQMPFYKYTNHFVMVLCIDLISSFVCVYTRLCRGRFVCVYVYLEATGQLLVSFLRCHLPVFSFWDNFSLVWNLTRRLGWWVRESKESTCLCLLGTGMTNALNHQLFGFF